LDPDADGPLLKQEAGFSVSPLWLFKLAQSVSAIDESEILSKISANTGVKIGGVRTSIK
jgi:hypothetical protein